MTSYAAVQGNGDSMLIRVQLLKQSANEML